MSWNLEAGMPYTLSMLPLEGLRWRFPWQSPLPGRLDKVPRKLCRIAAPVLLEPRCRVSVIFQPLFQPSNLRQPRAGIDARSHDIGSHLGNNSSSSETVLQSMLYEHSTIQDCVVNEHTTCKTRLD
jgi:hypothetical protein